MAANVTYIPPKAAKPEALRVAAYCRVSSDSSDQLHSYATQIKAYTEQIGAHADWELVDVYADEGLTGTRMDKREDFQRLLADCRKGKVDRVLCKSISRFARNTKDCLAALRELSALGVTVYFEKENIDTGTLTSELMVSVSGALAQQESISISQNQRMSYKRRMERGEFITCKAPFGYRLVEGKELEIIPEEAERVRWIFASYLSGKSLEWIAEQMEKAGIPTPDNAPYWQKTSILYILTNEKYIGDSLNQKYLSGGFPFLKRRNHSEADQYYIENTHPAIVSRETFEKVQQLLQRKGARQRMEHPRSSLVRKIRCGQCGTVFSRRAGRSGLVTWSCRKHDRDAASCPVGRIPETEIYAAFVRMYNKLRANADIVLKPALTQLDDLERALQRENPAMLEVNRAIAQAAEQSHNISKLQAAGLLDTDACAAKLNAINIQLTQLRRERRRLLEHDDIEDTIGRLHQTADAIKAGPERLDTFDEDLFEDWWRRSWQRARLASGSGSMAELSWQRKSGGQNGELSEDTVWLSDPKRRTDPSAGGGRCGQSHSGPLPGRPILSEAGRPAESEEYPLQPGSAGMGQAQGQTPAGEPPLHRTEGLSGHLRRWDFSLRPEPHSGKNGKTDTQSRAASPQVGKPSALCRLRRGPPSDGRQEPPERHPIPEMCPMRRCHHHAGRSPAG